MPGLFDMDDDERRQQLGLLGLLVGGNILAANAPGVTTGQALGAGLSAGAHGMQQMQVQRLRAQQLAQQKALQDAQIGRLTNQAAQEKAKAEALQRIFAGGGAGGKPNMADVAVLDPTAAVRMTLGLDTPASIKEWEHFNALPQEQKVEYLNMKRAQTWRDFGGYQAAPNPVNPSLPPVATVPNTLRPGEEPTVRGEQARMTEVGKAGGQAEARLPAAESQADMLIGMVERVVNHPALENVVGLPQNVSGFTARIIGTGLPASPEADFMASVRQLQGAQFLAAYEQLKGGGQITEAEGRKAETAIARMQDLNVGVSDYRKAANDFIDAIKTGVEKAKKAAGPGARSGQKPGWPEPGSVHDGWVYGGGDPNNRMNWRRP